MIRRLLVLLAVANYFLAVTVGVGLHDHGQHSAAAGHACAHAAGGRHVADCQKFFAAGEHGPCQICRFLAQKPIPAHAVEAIQYAALVEEVAADGPVRPAVEVPSTQQIRGPPRAA